MQDDPIEKTESVASALFFNVCHEAPTAMGTVCIDIGGSTSDIAIWQDDKLRWQTSVKFAGRDIFLDALSINPAVLKFFGTDTSSLERAKQAGFVTFYAQADSIIKAEGDIWLQKLPNHVREPNIQPLLQHIAIGLSGLFYYVGLILNHLVSTEKYRKQIPDIYVGGNGSRLFHWLDAGSYSRKSPINELLKSVLLHASSFEGQQKDFNVVISSQPKAEAAYGLVCDKPLEFDLNGEEGVLAGEIFLEQNQRQPWNELLNPARLQKAITVPASLDRFKDFLQIFNKYATSRNALVRPVEANDMTVRDIRNRLAGNLVDLSKQDVKTMLVQPIFILS